MHKDVKKILVSEQQIVARCKELAVQIDSDYKGQRITLVALLSGSIPFLAELMKHITIECELDFMDVSSYQGVKSTGEVRILKDLARPVVDCNILIVEDVIDTGNTLNIIKGIIENRGPKSVKIVTLLDKVEGRTIDINADYIGFTIPNEFAVGFGLDYDELYRNLPYVGILKEERYM